MSSKMPKRRLNGIGYLSLSFLCSSLLWADITFDKTNGQKETTLGKAKALIDRDKEPDISSTTTIRVEGATFRPFRLFLEGKGTKGDKLAETILSVIENDLRIAGGFTIDKSTFLTSSNEALVKARGLEGFASVSFLSDGDEIKAVIENKNLINGGKWRTSFKGKKSDHRVLAHHLAKNIFEKFIGPENLFLSELAALKHTNEGPQIVLMDFDGQNERPLTAGKWLKTSPFFAPDGKTILYTVVMPTGHAIIEQVIGSRSIRFVLKKPGLNLDPRIVPHKNTILATLSFGQEPNVYEASRDGKIIRKLTDSLGMNLSPTVSSDGKTFAFVSTRSGTPQIYLQGLDKKNAQRITYQGRYNQTPQFSPDDNKIAFTGRDEKGRFGIYLIDLVAKPPRVSKITDSSVNSSQEPSFSISGRHVIYASETGLHSHNELYLNNLNGTNPIRLTFAQKGGYSAPIFRPRS